jgi:repressor LexA
MTSKNQNGGQPKQKPLAKLTERQSEVLQFIKQEVKAKGIAPTRADIAGHFGFKSKNAATDHIKALQRKGYIKVYNDMSRGIQVTKSRKKSAANEDMLPIVGSVAAGSPIEAVENIEDHVEVAPGLFKQKPTYLLRVRGDSMKDAGILDGDLIAVRKTATANNGEIVVARIDDEVTVKRLKIKKSSAALLPENKAYKPILVAANDLVIEGVFVGLIRDRI